MNSSRRSRAPRLKPRTCRETGDGPRPRLIEPVRPRCRTPTASDYEMPDEEFPGPSGMRLSPSAITTLHEPSKCERRAWLRGTRRVIEAGPSGFQQFLFDQGIVHEQRVAASLRASGIELVDVSDLPEEKRISRTREAVESGGPGGVTQGQLFAGLEVEGRLFEGTGRPDFLFPEHGIWVIADAKSTRKIHSNGKERSDKRSIFLQMRLYAMLFEASFPGVPFELRVHNGSGESP